MDRLLAAARLAGVAAAHAVWCVSDGSVLIPLMMWLDEAGERILERLVADTFEEGVALQTQRMESLSGIARCAAAACDGYTNVNGIRTDTIIVKARAYDEDGDWVTFGVPYTPKKLLRKFAVHPLRRLDGIDLDASDVEQFFSAVQSGIEEHAEGAKFWAAHFKP